MQFVVPAQLVLVLWLLATTAPAATALVNGSLIGFIEIQPDGVAKPVRAIAVQRNTPSQEASKEADADDVPSIVPAFSPAEHWTPSRFSLEAMSCGGISDQCAFAADPPISLPVLNTALQRHRPKAD